MAMKTLIRCLFCCAVMLFLPIHTHASSAGVDEKELFARLDQYIAERSKYKARKENKLKQLKLEVSNTTDGKRKLQLYHQIYREYYTFRYDSAMTYANLGLQLAVKRHDEYYIHLNQINSAAVLSTGGFYSQAEDSLLSMDTQRMSSQQLQYYYYTLTWVYNYWASFCENSQYKGYYTDKKKFYLAKSIQYMDNKKSALYYYLSGEMEFITHPSGKKELDYYMEALEMSPVNARVHASSAYGVARYYLSKGETELYEKYIVEAAISDIVCPLKENLALQEFSTYLYKKNPKYSKRAARYIKCSMEDAQFYNNRLRMVEISRILPLITEANHQTEVRQNRIITAFLVVVSVLSLCFLALAFFAFKQNKRLSKSRKEVKSQNTLLEELNGKLLNTNKLRETYMRLFMDISAVYIKKLDDYRKLVSRKIKAKQTGDLLTAINSYKLAEEEAVNFYIRFDKAFMELYPNFVDEFNQLLLPDKQIVLPAPNSLTKEVRIFALMRLGVTDGQELATLLFYSTQTIYNYKSAMRRRAKNVETFDADINKLCHVIS